jgi:hypothetical protein
MSVKVKELEVTSRMNSENRLTSASKRRGKQAPDATLYTASQAAQRIGIPASTFQNYVRAGKISRIVPPERREGFYPKEEVERFAEEFVRNPPKRRRRSYAQPSQPTKTRLTPALIDWLSPRDIPAILRLDQIVYDEFYLAEMEVYRKWSEKNPHLAMAAFDPNSNRQVMYAYIAALPLDEAVIHSVLRGERQETDLLAEEMQTYDRPGGYILLANSAVSLPEYPDLLNRVLLRLMDEWVDRFPERYIKRIYSQTVSESGDRMVQHFFMAPRYDLASNAYVLDLARPSASKIIQRFQKRLAEKAPLPDELRQPYTYTIEK